MLNTVSSKTIRKTKISDHLQISHYDEINARDKVILSRKQPQLTDTSRKIAWCSTAHSAAAYLKEIGAVVTLESCSAMAVQDLRFARAEGMSVMIDREIYAVKRMSAYDYYALLLRHSEDKHAEYVIKRLVSSVTDEVPSKISSVAGLEKVLIGIEKAEHKVLAETEYKALIAEKIAFASSSIAFDAPECINIKADSKKIIEILAAGGTIIDTREMGAGKTSSLLAPAFKAAKNAGEKAVYLVARETLADQIADSAEHYKTIAPGTEYASRGLVSVVNSYALREAFSSFRKPHTLIIDEVSELFAHEAGDACGKSLFDRDRIITARREAMRTAKVLIVADAHVSQFAFNEIKSLRSGPIYLITSEAKYDYIKVRYSVDAKHDLQVTKIADALKAGERVVVFTDTDRMQLDTLESTIKRAVGIDIKSKIVSSETRDQDPEFFENLDKNLEDFDLVIITPVVGSGVSLMTDHFTRGFLLSTGTVNPLTMMQMIRRFRKLHDWSIGFKKRVGTDTTAAHAVEVKVRLSAQVDCHEDVWDLDIGTHSKAGSVMKHVVDQRVHEAQMRDDYANSAVIMMSLLGFDIKREGEETVASDEAKVARKTAKNEREKADRDFIKNVDTSSISSIEIECLRAKGDAAKRNELLTLEAIDIKRIYKAREITDELLDFDRNENGRSIISAHRALRDRYISISTVSDLADAKGLLLQEVFEAIGIEYKRGLYTGTFSKIGAEKAVEILQKDITVACQTMPAYELLGVAMRGCSVKKADIYGKNPVKVIVKILALIGLEAVPAGRETVNGVQVCVHKITRESVDYVNRFYSYSNAISKQKAAA